MRVWKNVLVGVGVFVLLVAAVLGGIDAYPYFQGKSFAVQIPNTQVIIQAGKVPLSSYTPDVEAAFQKRK